MKFWIGTSGYSYPAWKGDFYPAKLPAKKMLAFYSGQFPAVEINGTFRKLPEESTVVSWTTETPAGFRFVLKAPEAITHRKRLRDCEAQVADLLRVAAVLKRRRGPLLFQLPPNFKKDVPRLETFLGLLGKSAKAAFEFRHASWFDDETVRRLQKHSCTLAVADAEELPATELVRTSSWGYLRLRREQYTDAALRKWVQRIEAMKWAEVFVFFKHEDTGAGPKLAKRLQKLVDES
jgi:uncharacterized protein YecE (DUF72 family)